MKYFRKRLLALLLAGLTVASQLPVQTVYASDYATSKTTQQTAIGQVVQDMQAVLTQCGITEGMSDEEIANAISRVEDDSVIDKMGAIEETSKSVTEDELNAMPDEEAAVIETYANMLYVQEQMMQPSLLGNYNPIIDGVSASVSGASSENFADGKLTVTAKGSTGFFGIGAKVATATIVISNNSGKTGSLSFDWAKTNVYQLQIDGTSYADDGGSFSKTLNADETLTVTITTEKNATENKLVMSKFAFKEAAASSNVAFSYDASLGSVSVDGESVAAGTVKEIQGTGSTITAIPNSGEEFVAWINADTNEIVSQEANCEFKPVQDIRLQAVFTDAQKPAWFRSGTYLYNNLNDAAAREGVITLAASGVLSQGNYTIPAGRTLLIPFDDAGTLYRESPEVVYNSWSQPTAYRTLTMESGANLTIEGEMSLSAKINSAGGGQRGAGSPFGPVSYVSMKDGSNITVENGGNLYVWGYITGQGTVTANSGASVHENFQFEDFRGGSQTTGMSDGVFPLSQYYIQNVEVPMTLYAGAKEYAFTGIYMSRQNFASSVSFIDSSDAMFELTSGYIVKCYDGNTDRLIVDVNGDISISPVKIKISFSTINSKEYELPINNNITVNINSGTTTINQDLALLPGSAINIADGATCKLASEINVYVYDGDNWGNFCGSVNKTFLPVQYAPSRIYNRTNADLVDASISVNGTLDASEGCLYTTGPGADITGSTTGTAMIKGGTETVTYQLVQGTGNTQIPITPAKLKNADGSYTETTTALQTYTYEDGVWGIPCNHQIEKIPAVAATCTEAGSTEGERCTICGKTLVEPEVIPALGHDMVSKEGKAATCTEDGYTTGVCSRCGYTETESVIPALGHDMVSVGGKAATCTEEGYTNQGICSRCGYIETEGVIPALGHDFNDPNPVVVYPTETEPGSITYKCQHEGCTETKVEEIPVKTITDYNSFVTNLQLLEQLADTYAKENPGNDPVALVIKYIRTGVDRYNSGSWGIMAGYEDTGFAKYVRDTEEAVNKQITDEKQKVCMTGLKNIEEFKLPNGNTVDFGHMFGTMDITYHNKQSENHADVAGWAGDLVDLMSVSDRHGVSGTLNEMIDTIGTDYLCKNLDEKDIFSQQDMYGDLDAYYIMSKLTAGKYTAGDLSTIISDYFTADLTDEDRADYLLTNRFGGAGTQSAIRDAVYDAYVGNKVVSTLESTRTFTTDNVNNLRKASCYAFADYLCKLAGDYVEVPENTYYSVYSDKKSTLAPGITQELKQATTADNKNMNYYIATADLSRDDVSVYANYNENDPSLGWKMSRVVDQANAAQTKYGDPSSDQYIPNYNVITAINASGFNMSTGEPQGLFVMGGKEYHPVSSDGFFAILKNGKAMIGTEADYTTYKDQIQEAVSGFGCTLVKDGKLAINRGDSYYTDRANRTAVGITKTGKVVFMVLDGRQAASCGGSMYEIAQIMLEAGCVDAINLDGGGSTTYAAKQEGASDLAVVNSPSDGYPRSVSNSLMMVSTAPSSTAFDHAVVTSATDYMTKGSIMQMTATGVSATGNKADLPEDAQWTVSDENFATIDENGVLTALRDYGEVQVQLKQGENVIGETTITFCVPNKVTFAKTKVDAVYGQPVALPVKAYYDGNEVTVNASDFTFSMNPENAGTIDGFTFVSDEESGVKLAKITATLVANTDVSATISVSLYKQGEASFDFDQATSGDRTFAWDRKVSNATTDDNVTYTVKTAGKDMVTSYTFALDMTQLEVPEQLKDLTYMLPGADQEGASAWTFLLQLAERISTLTEVKATITFDDHFDVDYSAISVLNEYFELKNTEFDKKTNTLTLTLNWINQTAAIDPATANPLCMISGIKLTPKADADWGSAKRINAVTTGNVSYDIYLRTSTLYSFACKEENQKQYGLYPFVNPNDESEKGGHFSTTFKEFTDNYTLVNVVKDGWVNEDGGFAYYKDGERLTGVQKVDGYYYDFGDNGINNGQTKLTGIFYDESVNAYRYAKVGELQGGWHEINGEYYYFKSWTKVAATGEYVVGGVTYQFNEKGMTKGAWKTTSAGTRYYYGGEYYRAQNPGYMKLIEIDGKTYNFDNDGYITYGVQVLRASTSYEKYVYDFGSDGALVSAITQEGIIKDVNGDWYYVTKDGFVQMDAGLTKIENAYYFVCYSGKLKKNGNQTLTENDVKDYPEIAAGAYYFDENCQMVLKTEPEEPEAKNGIYQEGDIKVYYINGVKQTNLGLVKIGGEYYYVCYSGKLKQSGNQTITAEHAKDYPEITPGVYYFDKNCHMVIPEKPEAKNGIYQEGDIKVYYINGVKQTNLGLVKIDGEYYYVCYSGKLKQSGNQTITAEHVKNYPEITPGVYYFDENCHMVLKNKPEEPDKPLNKTGIYQEGDIKVYYINGVKQTNLGLVKIDGEYYYVCYSGKLKQSGNQTITAEHVKNYPEITPGVYYFDENCHMVMKK